MRRNRILLAIFAVLFLARAMAPAGFMPDFSGKHMIQICSGTEVKTVMVDDNGNPVSQDHQKDVCSFSFLSASLADFPVYSPEFEASVLILAEVSPTIQVLDTYRFHLTPPSRAPPSLSA